MKRKATKKAKPNGRQVQEQHRSWNQQSLDARGDKQVLGRLERMIARSPRPDPDETDAKWEKRAAKYLKEFRGFFDQHTTRLKRLGIKIEDFGLLDPSATSMPITEADVVDPRYLAAEEEGTLREMAKKGLVKFTRLG